MTLQPGDRLGAYSVTAKIGEGGMGEVYRARDTKLDRDVALKVLPEAFTADPERLARFEREAKVLASLNHPNIASIYGLEESAETKALVLELVEGPTLADLIGQGPMTIDAALPIARQIAEALEAAHEAGVIHRDLKPANIKVREDGTVKVLDFGLAKAFQPEAADASVSQSPTISLTAAATQMGMVLGTAAYMAPEQARGKVVDKRADIWAFGAVLFEMLSGQGAFGGDDLSQTLARVIERDPDWDALPPGMSPALETYLHRCLEKDPRRRVRDIGDVRLALDGSFDAAASAHPSEEVLDSRSTSRRWSAVAALTALAAGAAGGWAVRAPAPPTPAVPPAVSFDIELPEGISLPPGIGTDLVLSPDGDTLVYVANDDTGRRLYVRRMNEPGHGAPIPGTEGAGRPFFSPDGEWVGLVDDTERVMRRVSLSTGEMFTIGDGDGGTWGSDGTILFNNATSSGLWRMPAIAVGAEPELLVGPQPERGLTSVTGGALLPGDEAILFNRGQFDFGGVGVLSLESGEIVWVDERGSNARYLDTGHILFSRGESLIATPFDLDRLEVAGEARPVLSGVRAENGGSVQATMSRTGRLAYVPAGGTTGTQLAWLGLDSGAVELITPEARRFSAPRLSRDGSQLAVVVNDDGATDIWSVDVASGGLRPLTTTGDASAPVWSQDGDRIGFAAGSTGSFAIQVIPSGGGSPEAVLSSERQVWPECWLSDGERMVFREGATTSGLFLLNLGDGSREPLIDSEASEHSGRCSPDGRYLAYESDRGGINEVYVRALDGTDTEVTASVGGGASPVWAPDGASLTHHTLNEAEVLHRASFQFEPRLQVTSRDFVRDTPDLWTVFYRAQYDVHPEDGRILFLSTRGAEMPNRIRVVLDWSAQLERAFTSAP